MQWFRAEAEMQRWQEQWEVKQAEFLRAIRWFGSMADTWAQLSDRSMHPGRTAYAKRTSSIFREMARTARALFIDVGYEDRLSQDNGEILADWIQKDRVDMANQIVKDLCVQGDTSDAESSCSDRTSMSVDTPGKSPSLQCIWPP